MHLTRSRIGKWSRFQKHAKEGCINTYDCEKNYRCDVRFKKCIKGYVNVVREECDLDHPCEPPMLCSVLKSEIPGVRPFITACFLPESKTVGEHCEYDQECDGNLLCTHGPAPYKS